ncbi:hypothetical protein BKA58DRAFT_456086 [Alternaria rosae]|uniref:uncharacterized protein n=1 Tax=Alternaria rosae TaxID=1187941 RepID=UPI001E8E4031|nr:uncharacterized protein BKA58DRAFT_456086 [Alternaria rosae]KAH6872506.1 hypothetical protein BKA58DRAFT_456086 [Alternaria rosae]
MPKQEKRISVRKKRAIRFGRQIIRVKVAGGEEFTVPEDLVCSRSSFFTKQLQPKRKTLKKDSECAICTETLEHDIQELTYCATHCGNNFHHRCIEKWKVEKQRTHQPVNCPFCRQSWPNDIDVIVVHRFASIDADAFAIFLKWLYYDHIAVEDREDDNGKFAPDTDKLIEAYVLGLKLKSRKFCRDVIQGLVELSKDMGEYPGPASISLAYNETPKGSLLRQVLVQLWADTADAAWLENDETDEYPADFLKDLTTALLRKYRGKQKWDLEMVIKGQTTEDSILVDDSDENRSREDEDQEMREGE